jgi:hypothetical protein
VVRQVVGYDRFEGQLAYRQLTKLYRALRLSVNCFQPSMKLASKQREGSHVRRTYDQAQTPMQRLLASGIVAEAKQQELQRITEALDPMRLLTQLEQLQKALWRHAVTASAEGIAAPAPVRFEVAGCTEESVPSKGCEAWGTGPQKKPIWCESGETFHLFSGRVLSSDRTAQ